MHCLPVYGAWQYARLGQSSNLGATVSYHQFIRLSRPRLGWRWPASAPTSSVAVAQWNCSMEGLMLRRSLTCIASTRPYVTEATRMAGLAVTMTAAALRGRPAALCGRLASAAAGRSAGAPGAAGAAGARPFLPPRRPGSAPRARDHQQGLPAGAGERPASMPAASCLDEPAPPIRHLITGLARGPEAGNRVMVSPSLDLQARSVTLGAYVGGGGSSRTPAALRSTGAARAFVLRTDCGPTSRCCGCTGPAPPPVCNLACVPSSFSHSARA